MFFKSPGIENNLACKRVDYTDNWMVVTRQLRKYTVTAGTRDVVGGEQYQQ